MRSQAILISFLAILAALITIDAASDDSKCREYAQAISISDETLTNIENFRLIGPPKPASNCSAVCKNKYGNFGFEYVGKQACCCAIFKP